MGLFDKLLKKGPELPAVADDAIVAIGNGNMVEVSALPDPMFAEEMMGQTVAFALQDNVVVSPANGTIEVAFPTGHAFAVRMADGTGILVHIGIETVGLNGKGFKPLIKQGDKVKAGQPCVEVDWATIKAAGLNTSTMLIITEPVDGKEYQFIDNQAVECMQKVNK